MKLWEGSAKFNKIKSAICQVWLNIQEEGKNIILEHKKENEYRLRRDEIFEYTILTYTDTFADLGKWGNL